VPPTAVAVACAKVCADLIIAAAAVSWTAAQLAAASKAYVQEIIDGPAPAQLTKAQQRELWLTELAELYEWDLVNKSIPTPLRLAMVALLPSDRLAKPKQKRNAKRIIELELLLGISLPTRAEHQASAEHAAAEDRVIDNGLACARDAVTKAAAPLAEAYQLGKMHLRFRSGHAQQAYTCALLLAAAYAIMCASATAGPRSSWGPLRVALDAELLWRRVRDADAVAYPKEDVHTMLEGRGTPWLPGVSASMQEHARKLLCRQWAIASAKRDRVEEAINTSLPADAAGTLAEYVHKIDAIDARTALLKAEMAADAERTPEWCLQQDVREATIAALAVHRATRLRLQRRCLALWTRSAPRVSKKSKATPDLPFVLPESTAQGVDHEADTGTAATEASDGTGDEHTCDDSESGDDDETGSEDGDVGVVRFEDSDSDDDASAPMPAADADTAAVAKCTLNFELTPAACASLADGTWLNDEVRSRVAVAPETDALKPADARVARLPRAGYQPLLRPAGTARAPTVRKTAFLQLVLLSAPRWGS
jgi:hypothetical protein